MINLDDVEDGIKELERAARLGLSGAMITPKGRWADNGHSLAASNRLYSTVGEVAPCLKPQRFTTERC
jgi:hypothetical protein